MENFISGAYLSAFAVIIGALFGYLASYFQQKLLLDQQEKSAIKLAFMNRKYDFYEDIGRHVSAAHNLTAFFPDNDYEAEPEVYSRIFSDENTLEDWMNGFKSIMAKRILLTQDIYDAVTRLNNVSAKAVKEVYGYGNGETISFRFAGVKYTSELQARSEEVLELLQVELNESYGAKLKVAKHRVE